MWDGLTGPGPKMDMDLWWGKTFAILPPGHISRSPNQEDDRGAGVLIRNPTIFNIIRRNDHPAIGWSNVYFDRMGIIQWDSGSVTLTVNFKLLQNYFEKKIPFFLHNFLQNSFQNYCFVLFFTFLQLKKDWNLTLY
jgi:hypothetical protein